MGNAFERRKFSLIFVLAGMFWCFFTMSSREAKVFGSGSFPAEVNPVTPQEAFAYYAHGARLFTGTPGYRIAAEIGAPSDRTSCATVITPEISELARALQYDPLLIYDYVHNHIDYAAYFGSLKGATLTYMDASGNDFDQASLLIALLRASGYTASYEFGTMTIPVWKLSNWVGVGLSWQIVQRVFAWGGIPIDSGPNDDGEVEVVRVWVRAHIDGLDYFFDPSLKSYDYVLRIDIGPALGYSREDLMAGVTDGATLADDYVQNLNEERLREMLVQYSSNLVHMLRTEYPNAAVEEIIGGRQIHHEKSVDYPDALPFPVVREATWDEIPPQYTTTFRIEHQGIDHTFYVPEMAGKRLTITYATQTFEPELRLDGELVARGSPSSAGSFHELVATIDHPYAGNNGTHADQRTSNTTGKSGATNAIVSTFAGVPDKLLEKRQAMLDEYITDGLPISSEALLGESLNIAGLTYLRQQHLGRHLVQSIEDFYYVSHHHFGFFYLESAYGVGMAGEVHTKTHKYKPAAKLAYALPATGPLGSGLEHGVWEQMMGSDIPGVSTVKLLQLANARGDRVFFATKSNFSFVRRSLRN